MMLRKVILGRQGVPEEDGPTAYRRTVGFMDEKGELSPEMQGDLADAKPVRRSYRPRRTEHVKMARAPGVPVTLHVVEAACAGRCCRAWAAAGQTSENNAEMAGDLDDDSSRRTWAPEYRVGREARRSTMRW
jgi:hypothetical protein